MGEISKQNGSDLHYWHASRIKVVTQTVPVWENVRRDRTNPPLPRSRKRRNEERTDRIPAQDKNNKTCRQLGRHNSKFLRSVCMQPKERRPDALPGRPCHARSASGRLHTR